MRLSLRKLLKCQIFCLVCVFYLSLKRHGFFNGDNLGIGNREKVRTDHDIEINIDDFKNEYLNKPHHVNLNTRDTILKSFIKHLKNRNKNKNSDVTKGNPMVHSETSNHINLFKQDITVPGDFRIYVYNLSAYNQAVETCYASDMTAPCFRVNYDDGFGPIVTPKNLSVGIRIRRTCQGALFVMFHKWLSQSRYVTDNPLEADAFYLPVFFMLGGESGYCYQRYSRQFTGPYLKLLEYCKDDINKKKHFVTTGWPEIYPPQPVPWKNVVNIVVEQNDVRRPKYSSEWIVAPYPSDGHFTKTQGGEYVKTLFQHTRNIFILFVGRTRQGHAKTGPHTIRNHVMGQIKTHTDKSYTKFMARTKIEKIEKTEKREKIEKIEMIENPVQYSPKDCVKPPYDEHTTEWMRHSVFCLQPPGDSNSRKSFYDSVVSGCIPVLFELSYVKHVTYPFERYVDYSKFTVTVPMNKTIEETLREYRDNAALVRELQENLRHIMQYLQYNDPSAYDVGDDAFTLLVKEMYDRSFEKTP